MNVIYTREEVRFPYKDLTFPFFLLCSLLSFAIVMSAQFESVMELGLEGPLEATVGVINRWS